MEIHPDIAAAKAWFARGANAHDGVYGAYSAAYNITNENLRLTTQFARAGDGRVLTVAGSGDHPLFCKINGASHVDTFDISYNAKCIMDVKTAALNALKHKDYSEMTLDFYGSVDLTSAHGMNIVFPHLDKTEKQYMFQMRGYPIFSHGVMPRNPDRFLPSVYEYADMRAQVDAPFDFIWSDVASLHTKLTSDYDFMHLSNMFGYMNPDEVIDTLQTLMPYVRPGGVILFYEAPFAPIMKNCAQMVSRYNHEWATGRLDQTPIILMHRVRGR